MNNFDLFQAISPLPAVQLLLTSCQKAYSGLLSKEEFAAELDQYSEQLTQVVEGFKEIFANPTYALGEILTKIDQQMTLYAQALETLRKYIDTDDPNYLNQGAKALLECSEEIFNIIRFMETASPDQPNRIVCVYCGQNNSINNKFCEKCQAILPRPFIERRETSLGLAGVEGTQTPEKLSSLEVLKKAVEAVQTGQMNSEQFNLVLETMGILVKAVIERYRALKFKNTDEIQAGRKLLEDAVKSYGESVAIMRKYLNDPNPAYLEEGILLAERADLQLARLKQLFPPKTSEEAPEVPGELSAQESLAIEEERF